MFRLNDTGDAAEWVITQTTLKYPPTVEQVKAALDDSEYARFFWLEDLALEACEQVASGELTGEAIEAGISFVVAQRKDAELEFDISEDNMSATLRVTAAFGGQNLNPGWLKRALHQAKIAKGVDVEAASRLLRDLQKAQPGEQYEQVIAKGAQPKAGKDAKIKVLTRTAAQRMLRPRKRKDGSVDMRDLGDLVTVSPGDPLIQRLPPTKGTAGYDVKGRPIPPPATRDLQLSPGEGAGFSADNPDLMIAEREGCPVLTENGAKVDDVMQMAKVDVSTGHVRFKGTVFIEGDVSEGMRVEADGDIQVNGCIESATVIAGGSITVQKGIIGHQRQDSGELSCQVQAKRELVAQYAQYAALKAGQQVTLLKQSNHCNVEAGETILVGQQDMVNGRLVGGNLSAGMAVLAGEIGTAAGARTQIDLTPRYHALREQLSACLKQLKSEQKALQDALATLKQRKREGAAVKELETLMAKYSACKQTVAASTEQARYVKRDAESTLKKARVEVTRKLHTRLNVRFGRQRINSEREYGPCRVAMQEGQLQIIAG